MADGEYQVCYTVGMVAHGTFRNRMATIHLIVSQDIATPIPSLYLVAKPSQSKEWEGIGDGWRETLRWSSIHDGGNVRSSYRRIPHEMYTKQSY